MGVERHAQLLRLRPAGGPESGPILLRGEWAGDSWRGPSTLAAKARRAPITLNFRRFAERGGMALELMGSDEAGQERAGKFELGPRRHLGAGTGKSASPPHAGGGAAATGQDRPASSASIPGSKGADHRRLEQLVQDCLAICLAGVRPADAPIWEHKLAGGQFGRQFSRRSMPCKPASLGRRRGCGRGRGRSAGSLSARLSAADGWRGAGARNHLRQFSPKGSPRLSARLPPAWQFWGTAQRRRACPAPRQSGRDPGSR